MYEVLAIVIGVAVGAGLAATPSRRARASLAGGGLVGGFAAFALSGEIELSPAFLLWDLTQVVVAATLAAYFVRRLGTFSPAPDRTAGATRSSDRSGGPA